MASLPLRAVIALLSLIFVGGGAVFAATSSDDSTGEPPDQLSLFDDAELAVDAVTEDASSEDKPSEGEPASSGEDEAIPSTSSLDGATASSANSTAGSPPGGSGGSTSTTAANGSTGGPSGSAAPQPSTATPTVSTIAQPATSRPVTPRPTPSPTAVPTTGAAGAPAASPSTTRAPATSPATAPRPAGVGFAGIDVSDHTNGNVNISQNGQDGSFRTVCTVSHFNFDDAIVFPGQQAATHLHMYFGNVLADFSSTGESLASAGEATCQGGPLNRSAYWVPAVLDAGGNVRPAQYMLAYYKRAGDEDVVPYPNGLMMVVGNAMAMSPQPGREQPVDAGIDYKWSCGSPITGGSTNVGRLIPNCAAGDFLTLSVIFPRCSDGRLDSPDHKSHMAYPAHYGAACPSTHPIRHPQLTYNIHWNNNDTNTNGWYLSSDVHGGMIMPGGTTTHADWIGAWHPEVLDIMTAGCFNADHDCKGGTISPTLRLDSPNVQGFSPPSIYNSGAAPTAIPFSNFGTGSTYAN